MIYTLKVQLFFSKLVTFVVSSFFSISLVDLLAPFVVSPWNLPWNIETMRKVTMNILWQKGKYLIGRLDDNIKTLSQNVG